eukprot:3885898-Rhodomonas_salina.4
MPSTTHTAPLSQIVWFTPLGCEPPSLPSLPSPSSLAYPPPRPGEANALAGEVDCAMPGEPICLRAATRCPD